MSNPDLFCGLPCLPKKRFHYRYRSSVSKIIFISAQKRKFETKKLTEIAIGNPTDQKHNDEQLFKVQQMVVPLDNEVAAVIFVGVI